ncbi:MAG: 2Fe-2S iron-sulfur cluster-binding protein [Firmicutes bacterium]|nr:2Fe-2S iron-sulfur cluster-binding protein [Bacillota bacterium]
MKIIIDQQELEVNPGVTILEAARQHGIHIPTLCYHEAFGGQGMCRMCMVEVEKANSRQIVAACTYPIHAEIEVHTSTPAIEKGRRTIVSLLYRSAPNSEFMARLYREYNCVENRLEINTNERCILCRLCVRVCEEIGSSAISAVLRGTDKRIGTPFDEASAVCIGCAACANICPTGAIEVIQTPEKRTIWNRTFEMVQCQSCDKGFATREQLDYIAERISMKEGEANLCDGCRKKNLAAKIEQFAQ